MTTVQSASEKRRAEAPVQNPAVSDVHSLWSTPLGVFHWAEATEVNPLLARVLSAMRVTAQLQPDGQAPMATPPFYASADDLLNRVRLPEWQRLVRFMVQSVHATALQANQSSWATEAGQTPGLQIAFEGMWFQCSNSGVHHDVHTHGNCSWSGVYCVAVDKTALRESHPVFGALNGVTRFYGPYFNRLGGAHIDFGSAYLQQAHMDIEPIPGQLVIFPSWLPHQAMPYQGHQDRIIISFNASIHRSEGSNQTHGYARG